MNYSKVVDGTCKTLLGVGGNNDECRGVLRRTIEDHIDYWYRVQKMVDKLNLICDEIC